jgi:hypothetical protein
LVKQQQSQSETQQPSGHNVADEEFNENLILHSWRGVKDQVKRVIEFNRQQGIPNPESYIGYNYADESVRHKQKLSVPQEKEPARHQVSSLCISLCHNPVFRSSLVMQNLFKPHYLNEHV